MKKVLGIIGGMGSFATLDLFRRIIEYAPSNNDRDYLEVLIHNNSKIPDRSAAILYGGDSPLPEILRSAVYLEQGGADYIAVACVTAHFYLPQIREVLHSTEVVSILEETKRCLAKQYSSADKVGVLASTGAIRSGLWQEMLLSSGREPVLLPEELQETLIMNAIYGEEGLKQGVVTGMSKAKFMKASQTLIDMGATHILAGCSEVPMVLSQDDVEVPMIDSIQALIDGIYLKTNPKAKVWLTN